MPQTLSLDRDLYVPRELVFDAWTQSEHLAGWYAPEECVVDAVTVEATAGGEFDIAWRNAAGHRFSESGRFLEVTPPAGFVCTLASGGMEAARQTRLRLGLSDLVDACRIALVQEGVADGVREELRQIWEARLDRLEGYFSSI